MVTGTGECQAERTGLQAERATGRWELLRALGSLAFGPPADTLPAFRALDLRAWTAAEHTELFVLSLPPYASIHLSPDGKLGGDAADRIAGLWRALGLGPPADADHLGAILALYAELGEAAAEARNQGTRERLAHAREAVLWEHLWPWVPGYLDAVAAESAACRPWAELTAHGITAEALRSRPASALPLALRSAPGPITANISFGDLLDALTAPVRTGFILTHADVGAAARRLGLGLRRGERRFAIKVMLEQDPVLTLNWLAGHAGAWAGRHKRQPAVAADPGWWWATRAAEVAKSLRQLATRAHEVRESAGTIALPVVSALSYKALLYLEGYSWIVTLSARLPDLPALEVLLAVAHAGSLNAASRQLGVTQQAISARISSAEARMGVPLVTRTPRGSVLTPEGVVVAEWAARLLAVAGELDAGLAALRRDRQVRLRVSASLTIAEQLLPGWLVSLQERARDLGQPAADMVLTVANSETVAEQVGNGTADLGFVEGPTSPKGLRSRVIGKDRLVVVVRPDHPWARRGQPLSPAELAATPLVSREEGSGTRGVLSAALSAALNTRVSMPVALALSSTAAVRAAVLAGAGPAVLSELAVSDDLAAHRLTAVPVSDIDLSRSLRAIWSSGRQPPSGAARDLLAHVTYRR